MVARRGSVRFVFRGVFIGLTCAFGVAQAFVLWLLFVLFFAQAFRWGLKSRSENVICLLLCVVHGEHLRQQEKHMAVLYSSVRCFTD